MGKRTRNKSDKSLKNKSTTAPAEKSFEETFENLKFEDPYEDVFEEEDIVNPDEETKIEAEEEEGKEKAPGKAWTPSDGLNKDEVLEVDPSAYKMLHNLNVEWPALSFSILEDKLGSNRTRFPHSLRLVSGTQAGNGKNSITVMQLSNLGSIAKGEDESDEESVDDDDNEIDEDPMLQFVSIPHDGGVNRIRTVQTQLSNKATTLAATWSDTKKVNIYNLNEPLTSLETHKKVGSLGKRPVFSYNGHSSEGFAMDFTNDPSNPSNFLITGDCRGEIHLWNMQNNCDFSVDRFCKSSDKSVSIEDLAWSPTEGTVFSACDTSGCIQIFDTRAKNKSMLSKQVSKVDVNVLAWSKHVTNLLACGCDDGELSVWDLRNFGGPSASKSAPLARFTYSQTPITSVEWHPTDESMLCVTDDVATYLYDLSIEDDVSTEVKEGNDKAAVPPQLLFLHCGSELLKEAHWHSQIPSCVVTTSLSGLSAFIPSNL